VPVGDDQIKHIELTRQLAKSFNHKYGPVFPLPTALTGSDISNLYSSSVNTLCCDVLWCGMAADSTHRY